MKSLIIILALCALLTSCDAKSPASAVQSSVLDLDKSLTIGETFEHYKYYQNVRCTSENVSGRTIILATATVDGAKIVAESLKLLTGAEIDQLKQQKTLAAELA